jgi:hypothetical protein
MPEQGLTIFRNGALQVSKRFDNANLPTTGLDEGMGAGFARVTYKGGDWGIRYQGQFTPIEIETQHGGRVQSPYLDVVMLDAANHFSKAWYEGAYTEGQLGPPDCYSANGIVPDPQSAKPQCRTCAACDHNKFGSKINVQTGEAMKGKACMDMKRVAVVPVGDIENLAYGGPMMLSVPPSSLKRLVTYQNQLRGMGVNYATVWTRVSFVKNLSYPLMDFDAIAGLTDEQADQVLKMREHPLIPRILGIGTGIDDQPQTLRTAPPEAVARAAAPAAPRPAAPARAEPLPEDNQVTNTGTGLPEAPPPGVDPADWAQFLAMKNAPARGPRKAKPPSAQGVRTPPVSPKPTDSAAVAAAQTAAAAKPAPATTAPATPMDPKKAINQLVDTIGSMV